MRGKNVGAQPVVARPAWSRETAPEPRGTPAPRVVPRPAPSPIESLRSVARP